MDNWDLVSEPVSQQEDPWAAVSAPATPTAAEAPTTPDRAPEASPWDAVSTTRSYNVEPVIQGEVTQDDLLTPYYQDKIIKPYLTSRRGGAVVEGKSPEELREMYIKQMRWFAGGHSLTTAGELEWIYNLSDEDKRIAKNAYDTFDAMPNIFDDEYTWKESLTGMWDYAKSGILDPTNLLGLGVGKGVAALTARGGSAAARKAIKDATAKFLQDYATDKVAAGATRQAAEQALYSQILKEAATTTALRSAKTELATTVAVDAVLQVGIDVAYQTALIEVGSQEEYSGKQMGIAALGALVTGGIDAALVFGRGSSKLKFAGAELKTLTDTTDPKALEGLTQSLPPLDSWADKIARGQELRELDTQFWSDFIISDNGGLAVSLYEKGFQLPPVKGEEFRITGWLADSIRHLPEPDQNRLVDYFEDGLGITVKVFDEKGKEIANPTTALKARQIGDNMAKKLSDSGRVMERASRAARLFNKGMDEVTFEDVVKDILGDEIVPKRIMDKVSEIQGSGGIKWFQNNIIRLMVSHPGTTALNVTGWAAMSGMKSVADIVRGGLLYSTGHLYKMVGGTQGADTMLREGSGLVAANLYRTRMLFDPDMTAAAFTSLQGIRGEQMKRIAEVLPGGVEQTKSFMKTFGFDPTKTVGTKQIEEGIDVIQTATFVKAQDIYTKSQEYMFQLDKGIRMKYGMSYNQFLELPDALARMNTKEFLSIEAKAVDETLSSIFSKSFRNTDNRAIAEIATVIEDARNIPIIGLSIPFGRFFNNTLAAMGDMTGASVLMRPFGTGKFKTLGEQLAMAAVGWSTVGFVYHQMNEMEGLEKGLAWHERLDEDGNIVSHKYDFPFAFIKAVSRRMAYAEIGESVPDEVAKDMWDTFGGQIVRDLSKTGEGFFDFAKAVIFVGDDKAIIESGKKFISGIPATYVSAGTRWLDPVNQAAALALGKDGAPMDRKQGRKVINEMLRYVDNIAELLGMDVKEETKRSPTAPYLSNTPGKLVGYREVAPHSPMMRVLNLAGKADWKVPVTSGSPEADNMINGMLFPLLNEEAERLLRNEKFRNGTVEARKKYVNEMISETKRKLRKRLSKTPVAEDRRQMLIYEMTKRGGGNTMREIDSALRELNFEGELEDLTEGQLIVLDEWLSRRDKEMLRGMER